MELGLVNDYSFATNLDSELLSTSSSGVYLNSGLHSVVTINNLLSILSDSDYVFEDHDTSVTYGKFEDSRLFSDIVDYNGVLYQSIDDSNTGNPVTNENYWLKTNSESIRLKVFINRVKDRVYNDANLLQRTVSNEYLYSDGRTQFDLPDDYSAWVFSSKGSDYVSFRMNQISLQANTNGNVDVYVIHKGQLIQTLSVPAIDGYLNFHSVNYEFSGFGEFMFVIDSQSVNVSGSYIDTNNYEGFTCYTATGKGSTPQDATYNLYGGHNGLGFNITAYFDPRTYISNNLKEFAQYFRQAFEYEFFEALSSNSGNRSNSTQRAIMEDKYVKAQLASLEGNTVARRYRDSKEALSIQLGKVYDVQMSKKKSGGSFRVNVGSL